MRYKIMVHDTAKRGVDSLMFIFLGKDTEAERNISYIVSGTEVLQGLLEMGIMNTERAGKMSCKLIYGAFV
jgi:hypothetical protein